MSVEDAKTLVIGGAGGMIGQALIPLLEADGWTVRRLMRPSSDGTDRNLDISWDPERNQIDSGAFSGVHGVIHLGGANIAQGSWTQARKAVIRDSRVKSTRLLAETIAAMAQPPEVFVCASAIGIYGNRGDTLLSETSGYGDDFLADVGMQWEAATLPAREAGVRVVNARIGVVLAKEGGALAKMLTPFKLGMGGKVGNGRQYWSWIDVEDVVHALYFCLHNQDLSGPVNLVAPEPLRNLAFVKAFAKTLGRPAVMPLPAFMVSLLMGEMGRALLLSSTRVSSKKIQSAGYTFRYPQLEESLRHLLGTR